MFSWVYENFDSISGISFLPFSDHVQTDTISRLYRRRVQRGLKNNAKNVDWAELSKYESQDYTVASQELACTAGGCEVI